MSDIPEQFKRCLVKKNLQGSFEAMIEQRVDRYIEVAHHPITPNPHFAAASAECIRLYTDGYFLSTVMVTQSVAEGIRNFVVERNGIKLDDNMQGPQIIDLLVEKKIISKDCVDRIKARAKMGVTNTIYLLVKNEIISNQCAKAFIQIWDSFRNDVHHMNLKVAKIDFPKLAKRNIQDLATIEREIFDFKVSNGKIIPLTPKYWDINEDGTAGVFLRCSP